MDNKKQLILYVENVSLLVLGLLLFSFPLVMTTLTTDAFILPKQILLAVAIGILVILLGIRMVTDATVHIRRTPFDLPLFIFLLVTLVGSLLAVNRYDALIAFIPLFLAVAAYYVIINFVKTESSVQFLVSTLVLGGCATSLLAVFSFFKIYVLPYDFAKSQSFTPVGSLLDQAIYLALILPIATYLILPAIEKVQNFNAEELQKIGYKVIGFFVMFLITILGLTVTVYQLTTTQKPLILPFETGFQTAFAAISQDTGRVFQGFLFGSGFGTYANDFSRFKPAAYNLNPAVWSFTFFRSSSFMLELLATTGFLGVLVFVYLIVKVVKTHGGFLKLRKNPVFLSLLLGFVLAFILPFSFTTYTLLFLLLAIFAAIEGLHPTLETAKRFFDVELYMVAFKKGLFGFTNTAQMPQTEGTDGYTWEEFGNPRKSYSKFLPITFFAVLLLIAGFILYYGGRFVSSDLTFQQSLVAAAANNGTKTYELQTNSINQFPYRDAYYRIFSQTNLALANFLASQQPKGSSPSAQTQQTIYTLIQQSINSARSATTLSPQSALNWQNLGSIYRSLIGFGQNAESFAVLANQQAVALDPNNPQEYVNLGGIYYQLGQWDNAQRQFQIAVQLKPDYANAYYNLGHSLENKGDLQGALAQYQTVQSLVAQDPANLKRMTDEIDVLQKKIGGGKGQAANAVPGTGSSQEPLGIPTPSPKLPEQNPPVKIPPPTTSSESGKSGQ